MSADRAGRTVFLVVGLAALAAVLLLLVHWVPDSGEPAPGSGKSDGGHADAVPTELPRLPPADAYAGSAACAECHREIHEAWLGSQHARAESALDPARDGSAFDPPREIVHGTQTSTARGEADDPATWELVTLGAGEEPTPYHVERAFAVEPLRQYLVDAGGGRLQVTELAFDVGREEWFDVFGDEDRRPGEWGHWTGRAMNWNSMCAACHNTRVDKGYDAASDSYATTVREMGVGCEACHGPSAAHAAGGPPPARLDKPHLLDLCGSCHARRSELTGAFVPGDLFLDHYAPMIPDLSDVYHADGQVQAEDFEYVSFLGSRMHDEAVTCLDCHDPHHGKRLRPGNRLCLECHEARPTFREHSFHPPDSAGAACVGCHMPETTYMERDPRRDHGFTIPDPRLTIELGIPNACNRCHEDRTPEWADEQVAAWYGKRMEGPRRARARAVAWAREGDRRAVDELMGVALLEKNALWRAVAAGLLLEWGHEPPVTSRLAGGLRDADPLVRTMAARSLAPLAAADAPGARVVQQALLSCLSDPVRAVRVEAARALRSAFEPESGRAAELRASYERAADQPTGQAELGAWYLERGRPAQALEHFERAVKWDPGSAMLQRALGVTLSNLDRDDEAVAALEIACKLEPDQAGLRYALGLAYNEAGRPRDAVLALAHAVSLEPEFARAWYNLGLARRDAGDTDEALLALRRAEELDPQGVDAAWARALLLRDLGRNDEAAEAARRVLAVDGGHSGARALLQELLSAPR